MTLLDRAARSSPWTVSALARHGGRLAVATHEGTLTYRQLADRVDDVARRLGPQRRLVLVAAANQLDALVGYLAALSGGHAVALAPGDRPHSTDALVDATDPDVITSAATGWDVAERRPGTAHDLHPELAVLLSTSGSTGSPKLVRLSHRNVESNASAIAEYLHLTPDDRAATTLPMHYCYGLSVVNSHLATGAGLLLTDRSVVDPCFWDLVRQQGATSFAGVPHTFDLLDRVGFEHMALPNLRYLTSAGGRLHPDVARRYAALGARDGWDLYLMYGQTEATARMAYLPPHLVAEHPDAIGIPIPGGSFELHPVEEVEDPEVGELVYRGDNVMLGYAQSTEDLSLGSTLEELRTGDLARRTPEGLYEIVGRRSRFAKIFGLRVDLQHLEASLLADGISAACASDDHQLVVAVAGSGDPTPARRVVAATTGLPPSRLVVVAVPELPRLASGKVDHAAVLQLARQGSPPLDAAPEPARPDGVHPEVHRRFSEVLQRPDVDGDSTFVGLGGDSLSYVEMSIALEDVLGHLPPAWHTTPLRDLRPSATPSGRVRRADTTVVLRAIAIVLVVGTHIKLFDVLGGAHLLLAVAGYNFTRFGERAPDMARSIARIAVPSAIWLAIATQLNDRIHLTHVLLVDGWFGPEDAHGGYWYIEAIVQILVPLVALLSIPAVRRFERAHRFGFAAGILGVGLLVRFHVLDIPTVEPHDIRSHDILWLFAVGWVAAQARSVTDRLVLSAVVVASVPGYFGEPGREVLVIAGLLLLVWVRTLPLVRPVTRVAGAVAGASLYIYLTHWQVFPPIDDRFGPQAALAGAVGAGVVAWWVSRQVSAGLGTVARRVRARTGAPQAVAAAAAEAGSTAPASVLASSGA